MTWKSQIVNLTVTECMLLISLANRPGAVKKREQLMDAAYQDNIYVSDRTIDCKSFFLFKISFSTKSSVILLSPSFHQPTHSQPRSSIPFNCPKICLCSVPIAAI